MSDIPCTGREILEHDFDGDLEAYAEFDARPKPDGVEDDPYHPWHQRKAVAKLTVDLPDNCISIKQCDPLFTRQEICQFFEISDSGFGKWGVPPRCKSGKYTCYSMSDVFAYYGARVYIQARKKHSGEAPPGTIHQIAARLRAEDQNEDGPAKFWCPPGDLTKLQEGPFA